MKDELEIAAAKRKQLRKFLKNPGFFEVALTRFSFISRA